MTDRTAFEAQAWIAIADQKPPANQEVLFAVLRDGEWILRTGYRSWRGSKYVMDASSWMPTHWQPLPAPPSGP